jgi:RNA polymerase sigma-70 factor (ECF subfamily)
MVAALYETHFERVARYVAVRIGNVSEAEDLASEVFLRALRGVDSYKETGAPMEAWLFRIAHNIVVDHYRKQSRRPASVPLDEAFSLGISHNPSERLERHEEIQRLNRAMEQLSEAQRQVLALRFGGEMTSEQVGEAMGKKPGAVREMQSAAIRKLRQVLQRRED